MPGINRWPERRLSGVGASRWAPRLPMAVSRCPRGQAGFRSSLPTLSRLRSTWKVLLRSRCCWKSAGKRHGFRLSVAARIRRQSCQHGSSTPSNCARLRGFLWTTSCAKFPASSFSAGPVPWSQIQPPRGFPCAVWGRPRPAGRWWYLTRFPSSMLLVGGFTGKSFPRRSSIPSNWCAGGIRSLWIECYRRCHQYRSGPPRRKSISALYQLRLRSHYG